MELHTVAKLIPDFLCVNHYMWWYTYFFETAETLAAEVSQENFDKGLIYPPFTNIRKISAHIAAKVAAKAYELGETLSFAFIS